MNPLEIKLPVVKKAAEDFLGTFNPSGSLPLDIERVAELGLNVYLSTFPSLKTLYGIDAFLTADLTSIVIDQKVFEDYPNRAKFSIAHEIGHLILHSEWYKKFDLKTADDINDFYSKLDKKTYDYMENQAHTFAGLVLVPSELLPEKIKALTGDSGRPVANLLPTNIEDLAEIFGVSTQVVIRRLNAEGFIKKPF